jgi:hypothetical protein
MELSLLAFIYCHVECRENWFMFEDLMLCCSSTWKTFFFPPSFIEFYIHNFCSILLFAIIVQQSLMLKGSFYMWLLQGFTFDPQSGSTLHIELARANSRTKRSRSGWFSHKNLERSF